jgi:hypothetical protein
MGEGLRVRASCFFVKDSRDLESIARKNWTQRSANRVRLKEKSHEMFDNAQGC